MFTIIKVPYFHYLRCWVQEGHTNHQSRINQKQTLFQKPNSRKNRSKLENKNKKAPRGTEAYQLAETVDRVQASDTVAKMGPRGPHF